MNTIVKVMAPQLTCPKCGKKHYSIWPNEEGERRCSRCKYLFARKDQQISQDFWKDEEVDAIRCDRCGKIVTCTDDNFNMMSSTPEVMCPTCNDGVKARVMQHLLALKHKGRWYPTEHFLRTEGSSGLYALRASKDKITLAVLNSKAKIDEPQQWLFGFV